MEELLKKGQFKEIEKKLLFQLEEEKNNINLLLKLAMVRLQYPFEDEETSIKYLNQVLQIEPYHFQALVIKMYLQNYYYGEMDEDFGKLLDYDWKTNYNKAIVYYIRSWQFSWWKNVNEGKKIEWLKKSIEVYPYFVYPYEKLGSLYLKRDDLKNAQKYYQYALKNVISTDFLFDDSINPQAFIDEYITGVKLSSINYNSLREKAFMQI